MATHTHTPDTEIEERLNCPVMKPDEWAEARDMLVLALDAMGESHADVNEGFLYNAIMHQRLGLRVCHKVLDRVRRG